MIKFIAEKINTSKDIHKGLQKKETNYFLASYLYYQFEKAGVFGNKNKSEKLINIEKLLKVTNFYKRFFYALIDILERHNFVRIDGKNLIIKKNSKFNLKEIDKQKIIFSRKNPSLARILFRSIDNVFKILSGQIYYTEVLFPGGSPVLVDDFYKEHNGDFSLMGKIVNLFVKENIADPAKINLLEIGGGTGVTSQIIWQKIFRSSHKISYFFTDTSLDLINIAKKNYQKKYKFLNFKKFDIEKDIKSQNLNYGSFSIIIASNIIHATIDIDTTLKQIKNLLKPGGILILNELTERFDFFTLIFGLTSGWWLYKDEKNRIKHSPLLSAKNWEKSIKKCGFNRIFIFGKHAQKIFIAQKSDNDLNLHSTKSNNNKKIEPKNIYNNASFVQSPSSISSIQKKLILIWQELLNTKKININDNFFSLGGDSLTAVYVINKINKIFKTKISVTTVFNYPTIKSLSDYISIFSINKNKENNIILDKSKPPFDMPVSKKNNSINYKDHIAVIGLSGRFPGADNINEFWRNLKQGKESVTFYSKNELKKAGIKEELINNPNYIRAASKINKQEYFDASFFGYTPRQAKIMDPQIRLFHEVAWEALENSGYNLKNYPGCVGVYAGTKGSMMWLQENNFFNSYQAPSEQFEIMELNNQLAHHIAHKLNAKGPAVTIDTGSSTSLVAIHLASQSLLNKECDMALAGGVYINSYKEKEGYIYEKNLMLSSDGHSRSFDYRADGTIWGSGLGIVVLKRLSDSIADRDNILAIIKGSAINNDGSQKGNYSTPTIEGQSDVIKQSINIAGVNPEIITYIEAHGTATSLGDPIEVEALVRAFNTKKRNYCALGSIKTNFGHLSAAAGIAGFLKTVLALEHKQIPANLHFNKSNIHIDFKNSPFFVNTKLRIWEKINNLPRIAGVSSFGIGGTNAHVVVEESPKLNHSDPGRRYQLITLSAKTKTALEKMRLNLIKYLKNNHTANIADISYTLKIGREDFNFRLAVVCQNTVSQAIKSLENKKRTSQININIVETREHNTKIKEVEKIIKKGRVDSKELLIKIADFWLNGIKIDWPMIYQGENRKRVPLPAYPFESERCFQDEPKQEEFMKINKTLSGFKSIQSPSEFIPKSDIADWFYVPAWEEKKLKQEANIDNARNQTYLIIAKKNEQKQLVKKLISTLEANNHHVILVEAGKTYKHSLVNPDYFQINIKVKNDYVKLFNQLSKNNCLPEKIIHLLSITDEEKQNELTVDKFNQAQDDGLYSLIYLACAIDKNLINDRVKIIVLSNNFFKQNNKKDTIQPEKATMLGAVKVIPQEYPQIKCQLIDIKLKETIKDSKYLIKEISQDSLEKIIVLRHSKIYLPIYKALKLKSNEKTILVNNGTYLITGGLGGVGYTLANFLAKNYKANLIIIGRTNLPKENKWHKNKFNNRINSKIKKLRKLKALGSDLIYLNTDITNEKQLKQTLDKAHKKFSKINGIIHTAGEIDNNGIIANSDMSKIKIQISTKVKAAIILNKFCYKFKPDFFLYCSSVSSIIAPLGEIAYISANSFLDYFSQSINDSKALHLTINWPAWQEVGMAAERIEKIKKNLLNKKLLTSTGSLELSYINSSITPAQGQEIFLRLLSGKIKNNQQIIVSSVNMNALYKQYIQQNHYQHPFSLLHNNNFKKNKSYKTKKENSYLTTRQDVNLKKLILIWEKLFGHKKININDNFFAIGGDSLLAIQMVSRIRKEIGVKIAINEIFNYPTIKTLNIYLKKYKKIKK